MYVYEVQNKKFVFVQKNFSYHSYDTIMFKGSDESKQQILLVSNNGQRLEDSANNVCTLLARCSPSPPPTLV